MANAETATELQREVRIAADAETVFEFFTDPEKATLWMGTSAEMDPQPGGVYRVNVMGEHMARGEYVAVEPPSRVAFTWGWEDEDASVRPGASTVEVTLEPDGDGTLVRLVHRNLPDEESRQRHGMGWDHYLSRLMIAAAGGDAGPDRGPQPE